MSDCVHCASSSRLCYHSVCSVSLILGSSLLLLLSSLYFFAAPRIQMPGLSNVGYFFIVIIICCVYSCHCCCHHSDEIFLYQRIAIQTITKSTYTELPLFLSLFIIKIISSYLLSSQYMCYFICVFERTLLRVFATIPPEMCSNQMYKIPNGVNDSNLFFIYLID